MKWVFGQCFDRFKNILSVIRENDGKAFSLLVGEKLWMKTTLRHGTIILGKPTASTYAGFAGR